MTVNELCSKIHLPSVVTHFSCEPPKVYKKLPFLGWYGLSKDENITFNCVDLFKYNVASAPKYNYIAFMRECYRYYTIEHPDLFEIPVKYSETLENKIVQEYMKKVTHEKFYRACRAEALDGNVVYNAKTWKFVKLLEECGMTQFINSGVGLINSRILNCKDFECLCLGNKIDKDIILLPTFFAPNNKIASLEAAMFGDLSIRKMIFIDREPGWYGHLGSNIVGNVKDLLTVDGCTWNRNITNWTSGKVLNLHHSLQPNQCVEIWSNLDNIATDKDPISLIEKNNLLENVKDNVSNLSISQVGELEKRTGQQLAKHWISIKTSEANISGYRFISNNGKYYYLRGGVPIEYTNFIIELINVKKENGIFYQNGHIIMNEESVPFKIRKKDMLHQHSLLRALSDVTLEAGLGTPVIAPNLKHYITNVIEAFNPVNLMEKPKPAIVKPQVDNIQNVNDPDTI